MRASALATAAPILMIGAVFVGQPLLPNRALASPDGANWDVAASPEGCRSCHLGSSDGVDPAALSIQGLPDEVVSGRRYDLTVVLSDPALRNAGFLLSIQNGSLDAGTLQATDDRTETDGANARSTWEGTFPEQPGTASWRLAWTAPVQIAGTIRFDLWGNAGNDDLSPLGDRTHHRVWQIPNQP